MNRDTFNKRTGLRSEAVEMVSRALEPVGWRSVMKSTGCSNGTLERVLDRENQDYSSFRKSGPPTKRIGGADLAAWLAENLTELSRKDVAEILRECANRIERGER